MNEHKRPPRPTPVEARKESSATKPEPVKQPRVIVPPASDPHKFDEFAKAFMESHPVLMARLAR